MKKLLLPVVLALAGTGGGIAAAKLAFPPAGPDGAAEGHAAAETASTEGHAEDHAEAEDGHAEAGDHAPAPAQAAHATGATGAAGSSYARLNNQFIVPILGEGRTGALMLVSITVETDPGQDQAVFLHEPKLRDAFLQVLFDHANAGGFDGMYTATPNMRALRGALVTAARSAVGSSVRDVLVTDLVRQDRSG